MPRSSKSKAKSKSRSKRVLVPAALHRELTEYTNLVRAIRTSRTLDLTTHLLNHAEQRRGKKREIDTWTPWPLIDCSVPEWTFEDEMKEIGETVARQMREASEGGHEGTETNDSHGEEDDDDLELLSPAASKVLARHAGSILTHIFNLIVAHRPATAPSMQNRLWGMDWEDVINLLGVSGVVDEQVVARAQTRLERIYGRSSSKAVSRMKSVSSARARHAALTSDHDALLFQPPLLRDEAQRKRDRKGDRKRVKSQAMIESEHEE